MKDSFFSCMGTCFQISYSKVKPVGEHIEMVLSSGTVISAQTDVGKHVPDILLEELASNVKKDKEMMSFTGTIYAKVS